MRFQQRADFLHLRVCFLGFFRLHGGRRHGQGGKAGDASDDCFFSGHGRVCMLASLGAPAVSEWIGERPDQVRSFGSGQMLKKGCFGFYPRDRIDLYIRACRDGQFGFCAVQVRARIVDEAVRALRGIAAIPVTDDANGPRSNALWIAPGQPLIEPQQFWISQRTLNRERGSASLSSFFKVFQRQAWPKRYCRLRSVFCVFSLASNSRLGARILQSMDLDFQ
jgi:hypothetical protein